MLSYGVGWPSGVGYSHIKVLYAIVPPCGVPTKLGDHEPHATSMEWDKVDWSKWSQEEQHNLRHRMLEEKHRGHDMMHTEMILILFGSILIAQFLLYAWRLKHRKSYQVSVWRFVLPAFTNMCFTDSDAAWPVADPHGDQLQAGLLEDGHCLVRVLCRHDVYDVQGHQEEAEGSDTKVSYRCTLCRTFCRIT